MATIPTTIRIDKDVKAEASELLKELGLDMSTAVNMFLHQLILRNGLPFSVTVPSREQELLESFAEAKKLSRDPNTKRYSSFEEALEDMGL
ncbi:MAG: type II toxin-antitoxin system RelB/DinJ family antitoxin [Clostridia bacterium]|nr:type II toxin-antitoxin system RelB/DinJ family antitoxin [Clostridia bacterium]